MPPPPHAVLGEALHSYTGKYTAFPASIVPGCLRQASRRAQLMARLDVVLPRVRDCYSSAQPPTPGLQHQLKWACPARAHSPVGVCPQAGKAAGSPTNTAPSLQPSSDSSRANKGALGHRQKERTDTGAMHSANAASWTGKPLGRRAPACATATLPDSSPLSSTN